MRRQARRHPAGRRGEDGGENTIEATVSDIEFLGSFVRLYLDVPALGDPELRADVRKDLARQHEIATGRNVKVHIPPSTIRLYGTGPTA